MWGLGLRGQVKGSVMFRRYPLLIALSVGLALATSVSAQQTNADTLKIYFQTGSAGISSDGRGTLDQAARLFRDGNPIVMIVAGGADTVGKPDYNLRLSIWRAQAVADGLVERGIPVDRLQVLGRGTSELAVETDDGIAKRENRVVEISWR